MIYVWIGTLMRIVYTQIGHYGAYHRVREVTLKIKRESKNSSVRNMVKNVCHVKTIYEHTLQYEFEQSGDKII